MNVSRAGQQQLEELKQQENRFQTTLTARKSQQQVSIQQLEDDTAREYDNLTQFHQSRIDDMKKAYDVELSRESEKAEEELRELRESSTSRFEREKETYEKEFEALRKRETERMDEYRKNQEKVLADLHEKYLQAQEEMKANQGG